MNDKSSGIMVSVSDVEQGVANPVGQVRQGHRSMAVEKKGKGCGEGKRGGVRGWELARRKRLVFFATMS